MACVKLCFNLRSGGRICVPIQCRRIGALAFRVPLPDPGPEAGYPVNFEVDGVQPDWVKDVNAVAIVAQAASLASVELAKLLNDTVAHAVAQLGGALPAGVMIETH